ncbi:MAG: putative baseplate assembly protein [Nodosilinea sp.]
MRVLAGAKFSGLSEAKPEDGALSAQNEQNEWPNFYIQDNQIDLDTLYPKILKDSWVVLLKQQQVSQANNSSLPPHFPVKVDQVSLEQQQSFALDSKITRLTPDRTIQNPQGFNPRSTLVLAQSEELPLAEISLTVPVRQDQIFQDPIWDNKIFLSQYVHGLAAKKTVIVSGKYICARVNTGGVFRSRNWQAISPSFATENVRSLAIREADGYWFAVTDTGVWRSLNHGQTWEMLPPKGLNSTEGGMKYEINVNAIVIYSKPITASLSSRANLIQGRPTGASLSSPQTTREVFGVNIRKGDIIKVLNRTGTTVLKQTRFVINELPDQPRNIRLSTSFSTELTPEIQGTTPGIQGNEVSKLFIGTDKGIYRLQEDQNLSLCQWIKVDYQWIEEVDGKDQPSVQALLVSPGYKIGAGTRDKGVFISIDDGETWRQTRLTSEDVNVSVLSLAATENGDIFAGTEKHGVFQLTEPGHSWLDISDKLLDRHIPSLVVNPETGDLFAGTATSGVFRRLANSKQWQAVNTNLTNLRILTLYLEPQSHSLLASTKENGVFCLNLDQGYFILLVLLILPLLQANEDSGNQVAEEVLTWVLINLVRMKQPWGGDASGQIQVWESVNVGLGNPVAQCFAFEAEQRLIAGTSAGLFHALQPGKKASEIYWEHSNQGLIYNNLQALMSYRLKGQLRLFAGTRSGIFRSFDQGQTWELMIQGLRSREIQALLYTVEPAGPSSGREEQVKILAGTREGLFYSTDEGRTWQSVNLGRVRPNVQALVSHQYTNSDGQAQHYLFAGTLNTGIFRSSDRGNSWTGVGLTKQDIRVLLSQHNQLLVGTAGNGIFRSQSNGETWEDHWIDTRPGSGVISSNGIEVTGRPTNSLAELRIGDKLESEGQIRTVVDVNSEQNKLTVEIAFKPALNSKSFVIHTGLENLYVTSLQSYTQLLKGTISSQGETITGGDKTAFTNDLNPGDTISVSIQDREETRTVIKIDSDKSLIINKAFDPNLPAKTPLKLSSLLVGTAGSGIFQTSDQGQHWKGMNQGLQDLVIRCLKVDPETNDLYAGTATGGVFRWNLTKNEWESIRAGLTNTDVRAMLFEANNLYVGGIGTLSALDDLDFVELQSDDLVRVVAPPRDYPAVEPQTGEITLTGKEWQVLNRDNFKGKLIITQLDDIQLLPATEDDPVVSEIAVVQAPPDDEERPVLTLVEALKQIYDPATVKIYANVVEATHGETNSEILGSGNGAVTNQRFALSKPPLTHVAASVPSGGRSELKVYVNEVEWTQVASLYPLDKQDRSYILQIEDDGTTTITFGDGQRGARLPSGRENITATYRSGIGTDGNVGTGRIALKKTGPPSLQSVINPVPATGGAPRESLESARTTIPATTRTLDRIVSLQDFEDFTQTFAGIGKAQAVALWNGTSELMHITIAAVGGEPVLSDSGLYRNLVLAIDAARDPVQQVQIASFTPLFFNVEARVMHQPGYQAEKVETEIRQKLRSTFAFEQRSFGHLVTQSEVIAAIQSVPGVLAVDLDFLHRRDASRTLQQSLPAVTAFWDAQTNQVQPAQLLMLRPSGIKLTVGQIL